MDEKNKSVDGETQNSLPNSKQPNSNASNGANHLAENETVYFNRGNGSSNENLQQTNTRPEINKFEEQIVEIPQPQIQDDVVEAITESKVRAPQTPHQTPSIDKEAAGEHTQNKNAPTQNNSNTSQSAQNQDTSKQNQEPSAKPSTKGTSSKSKSESTKETTDHPTHNANIPSQDNSDTNGGGEDANQNKENASEEDTIERLKKFENTPSDESEKQDNGNKQIEEERSGAIDNSAGNESNTTEKQQEPQKREKEQKLTQNIDAINEQETTKEEEVPKQQNNQTTQSSNQNTQVANNQQSEQQTPSAHTETKTHPKNRDKYENERLEKYMKPNQNSAPINQFGSTTNNAQSTKNGNKNSESQDSHTGGNPNKKSSLNNLLDKGKDIGKKTANNMVKKGIKTGAKRVIAAAATSPYFWLAVGVILLIIGIGGYIASCTENSGTCAQELIEGLGSLVGL